jgi:hypothetical protein
MKKIALAFSFIIALGLFAGHVQAQCFLNEPGSILVYPLIDNINYSTIIEVANTSTTDPVWLDAEMITHPPGQPENFTKQDFRIFLTQKEVFWWDTSTANAKNSIQAFDNQKGFLFLWAVGGQFTRLEIDFNFLKGDAVVFDGSKAFQYNALPHQANAIVQDRILNLDNIEYCSSASQILFEGFSAGFSGIEGTLVVASLNIDFINSNQPAFDINFTCWNEEENGKSIHKDFFQFQQYDIRNDLQLAIGQVFTPKWHCATTTSFQPNANFPTNQPLWAVFFQWTGQLMWGTNVFHNGPILVDDEVPINNGAHAQVVLPPVVN